MKIPNENKLLKLFPTILQVQQFKHKMTHQRVSDARTFVVLQQHTTTDFVFFAESLQQQKILNEKRKTLDDGGVWSVVEMKMQYFKRVVR